MRGIEAALNVLSQVSREKFEGKFATEILRKLADSEKIKPGDLSLASSLIYIVMRRRELWEKIACDFLGKNSFNSNNSSYKKFQSLPGFVRDCITLGTGGLLELRRFSGGVLVNGIIENLRKKNLSKFIPLVNALLHKVNEKGTEKLENIKQSSLIEERAMWAGVPTWTIPAWSKTWQRAELNELFELMTQNTAASIRLSPGESLNNFNDGQISKLSGALNLNTTVSPYDIPGFKEGTVTIQSESSILAASLVKKFYDGKGLILDMCSGRGVKAGQILQENPNSKIECWEISFGRHKSAINELQRLHVYDRAVLKNGNAYEIEPDETPSFIILDAPCSCSGTWNRKPESKWRMNWEKFDKIIFSQKKLLGRAVKLCAPKGYVLYITCSLLKQENENIIAEVLSEYPDECVEISSLIQWNGRPFHKGRPWGIYIWPETPWLDGFFCALIHKK